MLDTSLNVFRSYDFELLQQTFALRLLHVHVHFLHIFVFSNVIHSLFKFGQIGKSAKTILDFIKYLYFKIYHLLTIKTSLTEVF